MALVDDYYIGATHVQTFDDFVIKDPEKLRKHEEELGRIMYRILLKSALKKIEEDKISKEI